uniref:NFACT RNA-binding domain-containing protein n=1 Tax=viral metagenome TaxID=1070528 RepID=A0A6C0B3K8_9ZZZZ
MKKVQKYFQGVQRPITYSVGENAEDNEDIIDAANADDVWFHGQGFSSCHVIADINGLKLDKKQKRQIITQGALLCKQNCKYSYMSDLAIIYTEVKNIQKTNIKGTVRTKERVKVRIV